MKRIGTRLVLAQITGFGLFTASGFAQQVQHPDPSTYRWLEPVHRPADVARMRAAIAQQMRQNATQAASQANSSIPLWQYSVVAGQDGNTYQGTMVGRSPYYNGHRSTTIQTYLVPVIFTFPDGTVFDPTAQDPCISNYTVLNLVQNSPVYVATDYTFTDSNGNNPVDVGNTQYDDAYQRANFWTYVAPHANVVTPYHTLLGLTTLSAVNVTVPELDGYTDQGSCPQGVMDYNWWDNYVTSTLLPSLASQGVGPNTLPIFIFDSVAMYLNGDTTQCCALGDHGGYLNGSNLLQTYVSADFDTTQDWPPDISILSMELAKWTDDPSVTNPTPSWAWSGGGQVEGQTCSSLLEVGDPLSDPPYIFQVGMPNGLIYDPEEIAFMSWFYDQVPSIGAGGWYSDQGTLTSDAGSVCQSGGSSKSRKAGPLTIRTKRTL